MAAEGKVQVKLFLTPEAQRVLQEGKNLTGKSMWILVEELIDEVLKPELKNIPGAQLSLLDSL